MADLVLTHMTAAKFSQLPESNKIIELINGEVIMAPAPVDKHQQVLGNLHVVLFLLKLSGEWRFAPSDVYLNDLNVVQPDLFWVSSENSNCQLIDNYWRGAPDLVIEVLSPGTTRHDRDVKYDLYEAAGVREYWIVDATELYIEVYGLQEGKFVRQGLYGLGESFASPALNGITLSMDTLLKS
jgi:Uma2 family endonuclease